MTTDSLIFAPLEELAPSPTNPRKTFDDSTLGELAASLKSKGMIEPIVVRPTPAKWPVRGGKEIRPPWAGEATRYEIVAGERRYRASLIAELETVPCIVRELTDVEVLEIQTIENLQRDDLHPLEEAQGFADLMKKAAYDVARIAGAIGMSEKYVYDRVKLLSLIKPLQKVFLEGEITAGHAVILARLTPSDQKRATSNDYHSGLWRMEQTDRNHKGTGRKPVSVRELQTWVDREVRFDVKTVDLPNLFPETETALKDAAEEELAVVHITREYRVPDPAKDPSTRTYGNPHWKRADGEPWKGQGGYGKAEKSKTCEHSRLGLVVAGPGRGEAFLVCVDKKKCEVHWKAEMEESARRKKAKAEGTDEQSRWAKEDERRRLQREKEDLERARWKKSRPALLEAARAGVKDVSIGELGAVLLRDADLPKGWKKPKTARDFLEVLVYLECERTTDNSWWASERVPKLFRMLKLKAVAIVNKAAPKPKAKKKK